MTDKIVYMMRGLPSCGKSFTSKILAGDEGVVCETDEYFYTEVGEDPKIYNYSKELLDTAREWNLNRYKQALEEGLSPIVVDRGNSYNLESHNYAKQAIEKGYKVELKEPISEWWQEIRILLKYKKYTWPVLESWAKELSRRSRTTHRVPADTILHWMKHWRWEITMDDIINFKPKSSKASKSKKAK